MLHGALFSTTFFSDFNELVLFGFKVGLDIEVQDSFKGGLQEVSGDDDDSVCEAAESNELQQHPSSLVHS